ncbi:hypothetical protein LR48_Vigan04g158800 [Vigna angularis]|uniref:Uncharacterized protein n=1 Tax=Phaseolus angularis TaxID=3914 RepID=A0A0L9UEN7_PHAAN|nr:hypothetical protein LR48_Vigan04g158800 [Vigna angularis]
MAKEQRCQRKNESFGEMAHRKHFNGVKRERERRLPPKTLVDPSDGRTNNGGQRHHFNDGESFIGRNFNDGDRVLKDLSVKGERKFRKEGGRVSKRGKESRVYEKRQKVSKNYSKNALQNKMNL